MEYFYRYIENNNSLSNKKISFNFSNKCSTSTTNIKYIHSNHIDIQKCIATSSIKNIIEGIYL